jgi:hypothetical protein
VTCHNDRAKTANLSLQGADLATVADHAELWERVVRKLRAGVMPPPAMKRPRSRSTTGCATGSNRRSIGERPVTSTPGSVVLHRLNRTEYANAIRDLLDLDVDVASLLPSDDRRAGSTTSPAR